MTATTLTAVDPDPKHLGLVMTFKAGAAITAGALVAFADSGVSNTVHPATTATGAFVGVAGNTVTAAGQDVTVYMDGSVVTVRMAADDSAIDAGHWVMVGAVAGTCIEWDPAIGGHAATADAQGTAPIGKALKDSVVGGATVGSTVQILIQPAPLFTASS
jgi:hypothetical protein